MPARRGEDSQETVPEESAAPAQSAPGETTETPRDPPVQDPDPRPKRAAPRSRAAKRPRAEATKKSGSAADDADEPSTAKPRRAPRAPKAATPMAATPKAATRKAATRKAAARKAATPKTATPKAATPKAATSPTAPAAVAAGGSLSVSEASAPVVRVPAAKVALSTASVYPESTAAAFEIARRLGYDGIELMVFTDAVSQDPEAVRALSDYYGVPVLAVHSPCLLVTQRVWSTDPWEKLQRSQAAAERLGASTVVVHPPFRWQRDYAREFELGLARMRDETDIVFAVENMYPWRARNREWAAYQPDWDPRNQDYPHVTLDLSHTAVSGTSALSMADDLGDRLAHIHLADGTGLARDEHLVPGRGNQECAELLEGLARQEFAGTVVLEVSTRRAANRAEREADLAEALAFARLNLAAPLVVPGEHVRP
ncbi:MAG TPA: TIM barrel protein [Motilibacterales bacterium]|nr:TIM barrel protein [Motilibacterales bacterium]